MGRIRIGIDTGGTFTDVVAVDEGTGRILTTKVPSTPADPAEGFLAAVDRIRDLITGAEPSGITAISHGTTVATNQLLQDDLGELGFITTEGFEFVLEIARQSVPDGYGNSYLVKPPRIVPRTRSRPCRTARPERAGNPLVRREPPLGWLAGLPTGDHHARRLPAAFVRQPRPRVRDADLLRREHPAAVVSVSSDVLREYREYERAVTTLVDTAVKPRVAPISPASAPASAVSSATCRSTS
jgi:N-methylhydantoinase A